MDTEGMALLFFTLLLIALLVFFLITQQNTLKAIQEHNRLLRPGQVWLQLVPFFGLVWQFIVVSRIAGSLRKELSDRQLFSFEDPNARVDSLAQESGQPTYRIGIAYCTLYCCSLLPVFSGLFFLAGLVCWAIYWVQLSGYKRRIEAK